MHNQKRGVLPDELHSYLLEQLVQICLKEKRLDQNWMCLVLQAKKKKK